MNLLNNLISIFKYNQNQNNPFILSTAPNNETIQNSDIKIHTNLEQNRNYLKTHYKTLINSDIVIKNITITINNINYEAFLIFIDGLVDGNSINKDILKPLFQNISNISNLPLTDFIYKKLIPQNSISTQNKFDNIFNQINKGFCVLFIDSLDTAFCIEAKNLKGRTDSTPQNETIVRGSREAFVENLRTNTGLIRKNIQNQNLIIEQFSIGKITNTSVTICYLSNIVNDSLIEELRFRLNNINIDSLTSSGQLEQLLQDHTSIYPQLLATERVDKTCNYILDGRIAILINGSPFSLIIPSIFMDFLSSPEDYNLNNFYSNFIKFLRLIAFCVATLLPGIYIAITTFHIELIPSELLFAISAAREAIPFPIIFEIILMEISFDLIREAGIRVPSPFGQTIGIIGALILGDAAVNANIVSPILIIIVAFTGICNFAIPDFSLSFTLRIIRYIYIILGYLAGLIGIAFGIFIHIAYLSTLYSFGIPYLKPYIPLSPQNKNSSYFINPIWKQNFRDKFLNTKKPKKQN